MKKNRKFLNSGIIIIFALALGFYNLPGDLQKQIFPPTPSQISDSKISLGLDLQGGSQLDYKIDLRKVPEKDHQNIIDGVMNVINKRVNSLGVSEPNIYTSNVGDERHLIVELAGIKDLEQAKQVVGKTIQLEFKERRLTPDPDHANKVKINAQNLLNKAKTGDFKVLGQEEAQAKPSQVFYTETPEYIFTDQIPQDIAQELSKVQPGTVIDKLIETSGEYTVDSTSGQLVQQTGYNIIKLIDKQNVDRQIKTPKTIKVAHILVTSKGAQKADASITRSDEEAKKLADEIVQKIKNGEKFEDLAKTYSDDKSNKEKSGVLDGPVTGKGDYVKEFEDAAVALNNAGENTQAVKTDFGYHIIKALDVQAAKDETRKEDQLKYARLFMSTADDPWIETKLNGEQFIRADVAFSNTYSPHVEINFNSEGGKLFEEITARNIGKQVAIFVGGEMVSTPEVNEKISGGKAIINGNFTVNDAQELARDLNTGAIPAPIILAGQYSIGASLGQEALDKSLYAGLLGFILVAIFMILFYRLPGLIASVALFIYSVILLFLIKSALPLFIALPIAIAVFIYLIMRALNSRESGPEKLISFGVICFILFFLTLLLSSPIVMTLAGIAGVILSIGMAVDANILIFERVKEELYAGRSLASAIEIGFDRAWSSIRDSNFSSLITCAILFYFGSSIIQGFAFNLAAGILVSMFTATTITRTLLNLTIDTKLEKNLWLFGIGKKRERNFSIVQNRKIWYIISTVLFVTSILSIPVLGLKLGLDFTGGTLMELNIEKKPTMEELNKALSEAQTKINEQKSSTQVPANTATPSAPQLSATEENAKMDLGTVHIVPSEGNYIIKTKHITTEDHDALITELKQKLGALEEKRFQTVGATVGQSMQYKALLAVVVASIMIVLYIAMAFRKVPKSIGKWRFGLSAIVALLHDVVIMIGVYVVLGQFLGLEIDALFITALLTIMGFSIHDTIVVFDRIREKLKTQKRDETFEDISNQALNETVVRSFNTSFTVFLSLLALVIFGAENIRYFNLALLIGIVCGTYSSVFIASPILVDWVNYSKNKQ